MSQKLFESPGQFTDRVSKRIVKWR